MIAKLSRIRQEDEGRHAGRSSLLATDYWLLATPRPRAFTLVELMVAMALVIFIMLLMTQAFVAGIEAFRQLKSLGDMDENLRTAGTLMKSDIGGFHFEGMRRISDSNFWVTGPPAQGYMHLAQLSAVGGANYSIEGLDGDGLPSFRAVDHTIACTVKNPTDNNPQSFFTANISADIANAGTGPAGWATLGNPVGRYAQVVRFGAPMLVSTYTSQWAEVAYFLAPQPLPPSLQDMTQGDAISGIAPMPLFTLYRRQRLAVLPVIGGGAPPSPLTTATAYASIQGAAYAEISQIASGGGGMTLNSPTDLTVPSNRFGGAAANYQPLQAEAALNGWGTAMEGNDVLVSDVVSFHMQIFPLGGTDFIDLPAASTGPLTGQHVFDTWCNGSGNNGSSYSASGAPLQASIIAIKVTLRVWDKRTSNTRQMSFVIQP